MTSLELGPWEPLPLAQTVDLFAGAPFRWWIAGEGDADEWIYRRDPSIRLPWELAVLRTPAGVPYLAPEVQLLFKAKGRRPKDHVDAREVIPSLGTARLDRLAAWLDPDHPWQELLTAR